MNRKRLMCRTNRVWSYY